MKTTIIPSEDLQKFSLHFDDLTPSEFDSLRIILYNLVKEKAVLESLNLEDLGIKALISKVLERDEKKGLVDFVSSGFPH